ncbi:ATP synthase subunit K family protein [Acinetobacter baumannii]|nr:ATP synthase subunit K family protein [Acinetobacter baumannii]
MTTTTTTVLGLYGIGAYWLFKGKQEEKKQKADIENSSEEEK